MLAEELINNLIEYTLFAAGVKFVRARLKFAVWPVKKTAPVLYEQVARPDATVTEDIVSESSRMFVNALKLVTPEFVKAVCEVVPFKMFASAL